MKFALILGLFVVVHVQCLENASNVTDFPSTFNSTQSTAADSSGNLSSPQEFDRFWQSINRIVNNTNGQFLQVASKIAQISVQLNQSSSQCYQVIEQAYRTGLQKQWSAKMISANAFSSSGFVSSLLMERFTSLGDFIGCISQEGISVQTVDEPVNFSGKYCLASLKTPKMGYYSKAVESTKFTNLANYFEEISRNWLLMRNRFPFALGICAPSVCSQEELTDLIVTYFEQHLDGIDVDVGYCQMESEPKKLRMGFIISLSILAFMVITSLLATILSKLLFFMQTSTAKVHPISASLLRSKLNWPLVVKLINCFDIEHNLRCLFKVESRAPLSKHVFDLRFIYGLKAFMMMFTVYVHTTSFITLLLFAKLSVFTRFSSFLISSIPPEQIFNIFHTAVLRSYMMVELRLFLSLELFFVMSGFLVTYTVLSKSKKVPNFFSYVFIRYFRLLPSVVAVLCLTIVLQKSGKGPMFHEELTDPFVKPCSEYWWTHVLFINNFWTLDKMCNPSLWFIAADFQLHILLYVVIFLYFHKKLFAYFMSIVMMTCSILLYFLYNYLGFSGWPRTDYTLLFHAPALLDGIRLFYTSFQPHILSYFFGALTAMRLMKLQKTHTSSSLRDSLIIAPIIVTFALLLYPSQLFETDLNEKSFNFLFWFAFLFSVTMICEGFLFHYFVFSRDFFLKRILSTKFLVPVGRLSYGIYLVNPLIGWFNTLQTWDTQTLTIHVLSVSFSSVYLQCFFCAIILYVFFQSPVYNITQLLVNQKSARQLARNSKSAHVEAQQIALTTCSSHLMNYSTKVSVSNDTTCAQIHL